jgi:hypothetical protein
MLPTRRQPLSDAKMLLTRIIGITLSITAALACTFYGLRHYRNYAHMGKQPEEITAAQAFDVPLDATTRWVRLKESLNLNCSHSLQQIDGGTVEFTELLAYDKTGKYAFLLEYKGDTDCASTRAVPFEGVLKAAPIYWWTGNKMPTPNSEPVELRLGEKPDEELKQAFYALIFMPFALGLAVFLIRYQRPDYLQPANRPPQGKATASVR